MLRKFAVVLLLSGVFVFQGCVATSGMDIPTPGQKEHARCKNRCTEADRTLAVVQNLAVLFVTGMVGYSPSIPRDRID